MCPYNPGDVVATSGSCQIGWNRQLGGKVQVIEMRVGKCTVLAILAIMVVFARCATAAPLFKGSEKIPADAIVLFDGKDLSKWVQCGTENPVGWTLRDGYVEVKPGTGYMCTKQEFTDVQLHLEFWLPLMADAKGQARANSGVYLQGRYEIQVLDSYGLKSEAGDCGGVYGVAAPLVKACRPPETWQSFDIVFHAPKFDAQGKQTSKARATVFQNGVLIHENTEWPEPGRAALDNDSKLPGPISLQDHSCLVRYRNIWVRPL